MASTTVRLSAPIAQRGVAAPTRTTARSSTVARVAPVARVASSAETVVVDAKASRDDDSLVSRGQVRAMNLYSNDRCDETNVRDVARDVHGARVDRGVGWVGPPRGLIDRTLDGYGSLDIV